MPEFEKISIELLYTETKIFFTVKEKGSKISVKSVNVYFLHIIN